MEYTLVLDDKDLIVIDAGLQELAFKHAYPVIHKINEQIDIQNKENLVNDKQSN